MRGKLPFGEAEPLFACRNCIDVRESAAPFYRSGQTAAEQFVCTSQETADLVGTSYRSGGRRMDINEIRKAVQGFIRHINERPSEVIQRLCEKM